MALVDLKNRSADLNRLHSDKMRKFAYEYLIDRNATQAAIRAGYSKKTAGVRGQKLLKHPVIAAWLGKQAKQDLERLQLDREEVLRQLFYLATRSGVDFVDENGRIITDIHKLPVRAQEAIDGIKQKVKRYTTENGEEIEEVQTELKLVGKGGAIDMAMKHFGLYAPERQDVKMAVLDWDKLLTGKGKEVPDLIEDQLKKAENGAEKHE